MHPHGKLSSAAAWVDHRQRQGTNSAASYVHYQCAVDDVLRTLGLTTTNYDLPAFLALQQL